MAIWLCKWRECVSETSAQTIEQRAKDLKRPQTCDGFETERGAGDNEQKRSSKKLIIFYYFLIEFCTDVFDLNLVLLVWLLFICVPYSGFTYHVKFGDMVL